MIRDTVRDWVEAEFLPIVAEQDVITNAIIYTVVLSAASFVVGEVFIPRLIGQRSDEVMLLVRVYMINIPGVVLLSLMRGLLEGTRRFGWSGAARFIFFAVQATGFAILWFTGHMTVATATLTIEQNQPDLPAGAAVPCFTLQQADCGKPQDTNVN